MKFILLLIIVCCVLLYVNSDEQMSNTNNCTINKVYYFEDVLDKKSYKIIMEDCMMMEQHLRKYNEDDDFVIRSKTKVPHKSPIYNIFYSKKFIEMLNKKLGMNLEPSKSLPIEFRKYNVDGHMNWHRDVRITDKMCPQIEVVYILENTSDSNTIWKEDDTMKEHIVYSKANSMLITQGDSVYHKVTPVTTGYRSIIKIAYDVI